MKKQAKTKVLRKSSKHQGRIAIVVSLFNEKICRNLLQGSLDELKEQGVSADSIEVYEVAGAFEIPLMAQKVLRTKRYDGVIALGCVIRGDTPHFDYVCQAVTEGCLRVQLSESLPIAFGVITVDTPKQAKVRSSNDKFNKGRESALALLDTLTTFQKINELIC